jgi:hypothetical protein
VQDEAQYLLDGLTIKHVHLETGTPAFLIQHCYGPRGPDRRMNALLSHKSNYDNGKVHLMKISMTIRKKGN